MVLHDAPATVVGQDMEQDYVARRGRRRDLPLIAASGLTVLLMLIMAFPGFFAHSDPIALDPANALLSPSSSHLFGTDEVGRDLYTRVIYGARNSLGVTFAIVLPSAIFGVFYGAIAGWVGRWVDSIMMRIVDIVLAFPIFILAMAIAGARGRGLSSVAISLVLIWWPSYARLVRGKFLSLRTTTYVEAAQALGVPNRSIIRRHLLPFVFDEINVRVTSDIGYALVAVTSLSFLGVGAQSPTAEWGLLISDSRTYALQAWWYLVFPGVTLVAATLIFTFLGDTIAARRKGR
jgi:peptide/nickel transport system permease protein